MPRLDRIRRHDKWLRPCGKKLHDSRASAEIQLERLKATGRNKSQFSDVYFCHDCEAFHVGHNHYLRINQLCVGEHK